MKRLCTLLLLTAWGLSALAADKSRTIVYINGAKYYIHTVQAGETLYGLSKLYGVGEKVILENNPALNGGLRSDVNIRIPDEVMTKRIDRMEVASADIFAYIAEHPEKAAEIRRFMNYYLPTTLKLLNSYDKLSRQRVKGENIQKTMFEIEGMMETIAGAFEKQLDSLFDDDALDIAADISVMESILKQEGLSGEDMKMPGLDPNDTSKTQTK